MNTVRTNIQNLAMMSAVIAFASCESHKKVEIKEDGTEVVEVRTPHQDTVDKVAEPAMEERSVQGSVKEINRGKDGYTAKIETASNEIYFVTVSHSNLKDHTQYKDAKIGDNLSVTGDFWKNGEGQNQITVRVLN
ncbi:hypothetical protein [Flavobacterium selenitireducens]|uniref:hypothetical protein n=1 Tax=Flavobacterium selenitireducens TaxID=2722704 RepID=UPI00168B948E|nr:hypothetical protein [Flavobacterium selenitireducens]MBD3582910.1 hypothetical protein [Flavobacterium selenitireducens]